MSFSTSIISHMKNPGMATLVGAVFCFNERCSTGGVAPRAIRPSQHMLHQQNTADAKASAVFFN